MVKFSCIQAKVRAVSPLALKTRGLAPNLKRSWMIFWWPFTAAFIRLVVYVLSTQSISNPPLFYFSFNFAALAFILLQ